MQRDKRRLTFFDHRRLITTILEHFDCMHTISIRFDDETCYVADRIYLEFIHDFLMQLKMMSVRWEVEVLNDNTNKCSFETFRAS